MAPTKGAEVHVHLGDPLTAGFTAGADDILFPRMLVEAWLSTLTLCHAMIALLMLQMISATATMIVLITIKRRVVMGRFIPHLSNLDMPDKLSA